MKAWLSVLSTVAAVGLGFAIGRITAGAPAGAGASASLEKLERERDEAITRAGALEQRNQALERRRSEAGEPAVKPAAKDPAATAPAPVAPAPPLTADAAERARKLKEITDHLEDDFGSGNGEEVLSALRHLAEIVPEGRDAAMALAIRINEDVQGEGTLGLDQYRYYQSLGDDGLRDLMTWSLEHDSPPAFRVLSIYSLPWVIPRDKAIDALVASLSRDKDVSVQIASAGTLSDMKDPRASKAVAAVFTDRQRDPALRAVVAQGLALSSDPLALQALEDAARDDPDERVRAAATAALVSRDPSADGFFVSGVRADGGGNAAGMRAGDIVVTYDGKAVRNVEDLRAHIQAAAGRDGVQVVVMRGGAETTLSAHGGPLGIEGKAVKRK